MLKGTHMITQLKVKNFKALKDIDIQLNRITLLTGYNNTGKSCVLQILSLLKNRADKEPDMVSFDAPDTNIHVELFQGFISTKFILGHLYNPTFPVALFSPSNYKNAQSDGLVLLEHPETKLHPQNQSALTREFVDLACKGVQFIIETHSDHIVNAIRVAVKQKILTPDMVTIYFLPHTSEFIKIPLTDSGQTPRRPEGFFDQFDKDLMEILGF